MVKDTFKKKDLINNLSLKTGFSNNLSKKIINDLIDVITLSLKNSQLILKNLGVVKLIDKKERIGRNPKTKEKYIISARKSVIFSPSKKLNKILEKIS